MTTRWRTVDPATGDEERDETTPPVWARRPGLSVDWHRVLNCTTKTHSS